MYEACRQGKPCDYKKNTGTGVTCMFTTCQLIYLDTVSIDKMTGEIKRHASVGGKQVEK